MAASKVVDEPITIDLGHYNEELRKYLLGQTAFPANVALLLIVCADAFSQDMFYPPSLGRRREERTYTFQARGLNFFMIVGKQIPDTMRQLCCATSPQQWVFSRSCEEKVMKAAQRLLSARD